jgi:hypothetical protein
VVREFQTPDTWKPKQGEGNTWEDKRLPIEVHESSEEKFNFGISRLQRPEDEDDRVFNP